MLVDSATCQVSDSYYFHLKDTGICQIIKIPQYVFFFLSSRINIVYIVSYGVYDIGVSCIARGKFELQNTLARWMSN